MRILSIGEFYNLSNTCLHRHWALTKLSTHIDQIELYPTKPSFKFKIANRLFQNYRLPVPLPDEHKTNETIKTLVDQNNYDLIWIDKGLTINAKTLQYIKYSNPKCHIISYTADNMAERHNQSQNFLNCIPLYDYHITTKSYIIENLKGLGAKKVLFTYQSYENTFHYPRSLTIKEQVELGGDVGFIGAWEKERCDSILYLINNNIKVTVFGNGKWEMYKNYHPNLTIKPAIFSEDYSKAIQAFKISLCFLRKINNDLHTSRTMEIPACGGFMLAERTKEHLELFKEDKEAVYFSSNNELLEKCRYYLSNPKECLSIAEAGVKRCKNSGYSNLETLKRIIKSIKINNVRIV